MTDQRSTERMRAAWVRIGRVQTPTGWERELYASPAAEYAIEVGGQFVPVDQAAVQWAARRHLETLITASGLSRRRFAEQRLARNESTLRRWTAGKVPIPRSVMLWMVSQSRHIGSSRIRKTVS
jgi:hypothetical protein